MIYSYKLLLLILTFIILVIVTYLLYNNYLEKRRKIVINICICILCVLVFFICFGNYTVNTKNLTEEYKIEECHFNKENNIITISYYDKKKRTIHLNTYDVRFRDISDKGSIYKTTKLINKNINIFNKYTIDLGSKIRDTSKEVVINPSCIMTEEELKRFYEKIDNLKTE